MADKDLKLVVKADDQASRVFKEAKKAVQDLGTAEEDARTNAQKLADEMKATADKIDAELGDAKSAVDALGIALGDEMVGKITSAGGSVDGLVGKFKAAGLTYDEIRGDADQLAEAVRRLGEIGKVAGDDVQAGALQAEAGLSRVHSESDQSRSVLANMVGNTSQDLGQLGGVAGSAGVALGQLAEYAVDGNIKLSNLAAVAGPLGLVTAAGIGISSVMGAIRDEAAKAREEFEHLKEVQEQLAEGKLDEAAVTLAEDYRGTIAAAKEFGLTTEDVIGQITGQRDVVAQLRDRQDELNTALYGGAVLSGDQREAMRLENEQIGPLITNLENATTRYGEAGAALVTNKQNVDDVRSALGKLSTEQDGAGTSAKDLGDKADYVKSRIEGYKDEVKRAEEATRALDQAYSDLKGELSNEEAWLDVKAEVKDYKATIDDAKVSNDEKRQSVIDLKQKMIEYLESLEGIPAEKQTQVLALIDQAKFDEAEAALQYLGRPRDVQFRSGVTGGALPTVPKFADGGVMPGPTGEHNLAWVAGGETILPTHKPGFSVGGGAPTMVFVGIDRYVQQSVRAAWNARERVSRYGSRIAQ